MKNETDQPNLRVFYLLFTCMLCLIAIHLLKLTPPLITEKQVVEVMSPKQYQPMAMTELLEQPKRVEMSQLPGKTAVKNNPKLIGTLALPFKDYIALLNREGAKLVLYDRGRGRVVNEVSSSGHISPPKFNGQGYSSKTRDLTSDVPAIFKKKVIQQLAGKNTSALLFLLIMPKSLEKQLSNTVMSAAQEANVPAPDAIHYLYEKKGNDLVIKVTQIDKVGKILKTNILKKFIYHID